MNNIERPAWQVATKRLAWIMTILTIILFVAYIAAADANDAANMHYITGTSRYAADSSASSTPGIAAVVSGIATVALWIFATVKVKVTE